MPESKTKWMVVFPFFNAETDESFSTFFVTAPCSDEDVLELVFQLQHKDNEHRLLGILRENGWEDELDGIDEGASQPLTESGYLPGEPVYISMPDLARLRGVSVKEFASPVHGGA